MKYNTKLKEKDIQRVSDQIKNSFVLLVNLIEEKELNNFLHFSENLNQFGQLGENIINDIRSIKDNSNEI